MTTTTRIFNFSAGPAVLPVEVLEQAQRDLLSLPGVGMSILEISHRSEPFDDIIEGCEADLRRLAGIPDGYHVLFLQGGASLQFSMVPMNLLSPQRSADYIVTGAWSQKAVKEAKRVGAVKIAATTEAENFTRVPRQEELTLDPDAAYLHYTTNNTIFGTEFQYVPDAGAVPLVADTSSDMFSGPIDVSKFALIYAGAQKNIGPAGLVIVIVREDLLGRARKADKLYAEIDRTGFYRGHATKDSRSRMNVTFRLPSEELEKRFAKEATAAGLDGLKGHRSVGGMRASIYNAFPEDGVDALVQFMAEFQRRKG